jgi:hypothetical protein
LFDVVWWIYIPLSTTSDMFLEELCHATNLELPLLVWPYAKIVAPIPESADS